MIDASRKSIERAQTQTTLDEAKIAELQGALYAAETNLGYTDVISPLDGTVVSRNAELGQSVAANSGKPPLFVIAAALSVIHIDATISAKESGDVKPGDKVTFTVEALPNHIFTGEVIQIRPSPQNDEHSATTNIVISAPNPDLLLKPGMPATIRILIE